MATFLELARAVAQDSGTVDSDSQPTTVVGQTGRLGKVVRWTNEAWRRIQNRRSSWRWLETRFSSSAIVAGTQSYSASALGIASRHKRWVAADEYENRWTLYKTATGVSDEGTIHFLHWEDFAPHYLRGPVVQTRPVHFSVSPDNQVYLGGVPNDAYTLKGVYQKAAQTLTVDGSVPEMPEDYHDLIKWEALILLAGHDEAVAQLPFWANEARKIMSQLERDQLPLIGLPGALA